MLCASTNSTLTPGSTGVASTRRAVVAICEVEAKSKSSVAQSRGPRPCARSTLGEYDSLQSRSHCRRIASRVLLECHSAKLVAYLPSKRLSQIAFGDLNRSAGYAGSALLLVVQFLLASATHLALRGIERSCAEGGAPAVDDYALGRGVQLSLHATRLTFSE